MNEVKKLFKNVTEMSERLAVPLTELVQEYNMMKTKYYNEKTIDKIRKHELPDVNKILRKSSAKAILYLENKYYQE